MSDADDPGAGAGFDETDERLDLTPRTGPGDRLPRRRTPVGVWVVLAVVVVGVGFVVLRGLENATVYFRTADEALAQRDELGSRRFRIEGEVQPGIEVDEVTGDRHFTIEANGAEVEVEYEGEPPALCRPGMPVVLEGHFIDGSDVFASDNMLIRHDSEYEEANPDRVAEFEEACAAT
jgi:cytochrome c-type biogenesis protein CcmE